MWTQPPPGGLLVPPFYYPVSAEIICGPRRPLAKQPAPQCLPDQVTISDVGIEEWLEVPTPCAKEGQITLDLTGPEQWPMEPMPPCMEFFQVEVFSVMMKCTLIICQPSLRFQSSLSRSTVSISALPPPTWACGPSPHLVASLCHPSTAPCRQKSSVDPADLWQSNLLLKAPCS